MNAVDLRVVYIIVGISNIVENKRYDIHQQCKDAYGLDLYGVLRQFRRSDDYLQILKWTTEELHDFYMDVAIQSINYNIKEMKKIIGEDMGTDMDGAVLSKPKVTPVKTERRTKVTVLPLPGQKGKKSARRHAGKPGGMRDTTKNLDKVRVIDKYFQSHLIVKGRKIYKDYIYAGETDKKSARRHVESQGVMTLDTVKNLAKVRRLEEYSMLNAHLTAEERNSYKDLGYTHAGEVIHTVIAACGGNPIEETVRSTRMVDHGSWIGNTTQHMLKHIATKLTTQDKHPSEDDESSRDVAADVHEEPAKGVTKGFFRSH